MRDWLIADPPPGWRHRELFKGITIVLGVPAAQAWAARELERLASESLFRAGLFRTGTFRRCSAPGQCTVAPTL
jgi:hypothetical protein